MKTNYYELFDDGTHRQEERVDRVRMLTLHKVEQTQTTRRPVRPLRRLLIAAAVILALAGGAFAAAMIWNAVTGVASRQIGKSAVLLGEDSILAREGYLEITPEITVNEDAPGEIERYYIPQVCVDWEKIPLSYSAEEAPTMRNDACFAWVQPATGNRVELRQFPLDGYAADHTFDTISLGFGNEYVCVEKQLGPVLAQCISVPPSEADGASDPGLQKLYWSDGNYLFTLEVNYDMPDETLRAIVESLKPVEDFAPYVERRYDSMLSERQPTVETPLFPTSVPDGWTLMGDLEQQRTRSTGEWVWVWSCSDMSGMELTQSSDLSAYDAARLDWLGSMEPYESYETTVGAWTITVFENEHEAALLWKTGSDCFLLQSSGPEHLSAEALLMIAESLEPL